MKSVNKNRAQIAAQKLMAAANAKEKKEAIHDLAREWNLSERSVYRLARSGGHKSGRRTRADKGSCKMSIDDINEAVQIKTKSKRKSRRLIMDTDTVLEIMKDSGKEVVSASRFNQLLRERRLTNEQLQHDIDEGPHINLASLYPNHCHQFDITNCVQYFFSDKGLGHRDMKKDFYVQKPDSFKKIKRKLLRFVIIDHYSGSTYVQYRYTSGERSIDVAEFLLESWGAKPSPEKFPFRGVPEILVCDKGSAAMGTMVTDLLEALKVERIAHLPGNPRAKGMVESMMNTWEMKFESRLSVQPAPDLETLNKWALDYCVRFNAEKPLSRAVGRSSRSQLFLSSSSKQLRLLPPQTACRELLHTRPEERTVRGNLTISFKGASFRVPDPNLEGRKVTVMINPYRWALAKSERRSLDVIYVSPDGERIKYEAREVLVNEAGFQVGPRTAIIGRSYDRHSHTDTQKAVSQMEKKELDVSDLAIMGHHSDQVQAVTFLTDRNAGEQITIEAEQPIISKEEALLQIQRDLGRALTESEAAEVDTLEAAAITRDTASELVDKFLAAEADINEGQVG